MEIMKLLNALPGAVSQGVIWGIMAIGVYITYRILDVADLTVDGSIATGGAVAAVLIISGCNAWVALVAAFVVGMLTGLVTGVFHTWMGIPAILSGILTQLALYSINLGIMSNKANTAVNANKYDLLVSLRNVRNFSLDNPILLLLMITAAVIALLYWFFGTEYGCALRATGANVNMARAQGINTGRAKVVGLMLSNGLVALSGALLTQYQGYADVSMGRGAIVIGLAAVIIGEVLFGKIFRNLPRAHRRVHRRHHLLHRHAGGAVAGSAHKLPEAAHGAGCGDVPRRAALEEPAFYRPQRSKGGEAGCLISIILQRPSIPA